MAVVADNKVTTALLLLAAFFRAREHMLFPFQSKRSIDERLEKDFDDPAARIDRHLADRTQRLTAGLSVDEKFETISGSLLVTRGRGKYIRVNHARCVEVPIPESLKNDCQSLFLNSTDDVSANQLSQIQYDLAQVQAATAERLKVQAGKYVDRMLTLSIVDPGWWSTDFDGQTTYTSLCDGTRLAELSGLTTIDGFPSRDLSVDGTGRPLSPLPLWMLLADRNSRVANHHIAFFNFNKTAEVLILPPSDGLDSEIPHIRFLRCVGTDLLDSLLDEFLPRGGADYDVSKLYANGKLDERLILAWRDHDQRDNNNSEGDMVEGYLNLARKFQLEHEIAFSTLLRTATTWIVEKLLTSIKTAADQQGIGRVHFDRIWISGPKRLEASLINQVQHTFNKSEIKSTADLGFSNKSISATVAAILGLMHIDQMPANIPWLTGAKSQRILGRLTPGRPSCWRQLLMDMADFQPPAMKLKDAI